MKEKLTDNLGLKILALLISIIIWFIVVNINDPVDKTVFRNIPVEILNAETITSQGKVYEILDNTDVIDVTIWAKRSVLDTISRDNIVATADMQEINFMDTMIRIKLATNKYNDRLESIKSPTENMKISIEDLKRTQMVISTVTVGEPAEGYILGNVGVDQNLINLSGPESLISQVDRAEVAVDVTGLAQDVRTDASVRLYDADNNLIEDSSIRKSHDQIKVNVEILQTKRVPLTFNVSGTPADGYTLTGAAESSPSTIMIAGKGNAIKNISQIDIPESAVNVTGQSSNVTVYVEVKKYLPENVTIADSGFSGKASVVVHIEKLQNKDVKIDGQDIRFRGMPEGLTGVVKPEEITVSLQGLADAVNTVDESKIEAYIDIAAYMEEHSLTQLQSGEYSLPVELVIPEGVDYPEKENITVEIKRKNEE